MGFRVMWKFLEIFIKNPEKASPPLLCTFHFEVHGTSKLFQPGAKTLVWGGLRFRL